MSDLVLAKSKSTGRIAPMSRFLAERSGAEVLDESPYKPDGSLRGVTTGSGRPAKPKTSVAKKAAEKKAVTESAANPKENDQ